MKNIELNLGGVLGALLCGGVVGLLAFYKIEDQEMARGIVKFLLLAVVGGAFGGNYLWSLLAKARSKD